MRTPHVYVHEYVDVHVDVDVYVYEHVDVDEGRAYSPTL